MFQKGLSTRSAQFSHSRGKYWRVTPKDCLEISNATFGPDRDFRGMLSYIGQVNLWVQREPRLILFTAQQLRTTCDALSVQYINPGRSEPSELTDISSALEFNTLDLDDLLPKDRRRRYERIQLIKCGLLFPAVLASYSPGSNISSLHWIWNPSLPACDWKAEGKHPSLSYPFDKKGDVRIVWTCDEEYVKKLVLYRDLTGDRAVSSTYSEQEVDERLCASFKLEEPDLLFD